MKQINDNWFSVACYYDNLEKLVVEQIVQLLQNIIDNDWVSECFFSKENNRGEHILVVFKTTEDTFQNHLKPYIQTEMEAYFEKNPAPERQITYPINDWFLPLPFNSIHFNSEYELDLMETGGLQASKVASKLLSDSTQMIIQLIDNQWNGDVNLGLAIQLHTILVKSFLANETERQLFFSYLFKERLSNNIFQEENQKVSFLEGLERNFQEQMDELVPFIEYLFDSEEYDDELLDSWVTSCQKAVLKIEEIQETGYYITPESFDNSHYQENSQAVIFPVLLYYIGAINTQLNIKGVSELNLLYILENASKTLIA